MILTHVHDTMHVGRMNKGFTVSVNINTLRTGDADLHF